MIFLILTFYIVGVRYPQRVPSLKDNWRGKTRVDKIQGSEIVEVEIDGNADDDGIGEEEEGWNENALRMALHRGMSMWRSHTGKNKNSNFLMWCH